MGSKKSNDDLRTKKQLTNNYRETKRKKLGKIKVEIDLPTNEENQLKYSLITNSSDGQKIIYLKKKDNSKERSTDPEDVINKFNEEGEITHDPKRTKKIPVKNAKAFLTSSFPKEQK